jgi:hypothetical protein
MQTSLVASAFREAEVYMFAFMHCWDIMKDEPKWQETKHNKGARQIPSQVPTDPFAPAVDSSVGEESPSAAASSSKRPLWRDATKDARKKLASSSSSSVGMEFVANLQELNITKTSQWN